MLDKIRDIYATVKPTGGFNIDERPYSLKRAVNGRQRRLVMKTATKINRDVAELYNSFYNSLLYSDKDYKEVYNEHLLRWHKICEKYSMSEVLNFDEHYFVKLFKPIE